jgi:ABC-type nitrate/sulfonate/bicarbonate transport system permease component/ABC-type nitrate/sulfonate/bicarbonate transport system substrate-binding protein
VNALLRRARVAVPPMLFLAALVLGWELYVRARGLADYVLPAPSQVWRALVDMAPDLRDDIRATVTEAALGLVLAAAAGAVLAVVIAVWPFARRAVYPLLVVSQTVPAIVFAPILIVWLGFGLLPKIVVVALVGFFPIVVSTVDGLLGADPERIDLVRSFGGGRRACLRLVQIPSALPGFFAGLKIAATYAVIGAVIGEWMGASRGLGLVMTRSYRAFRTDQVFAAVVVVALVSLALFALVNLLARVATPWARASAAIVLLAVLPLAACGGDDDSGAAASDLTDVTLVLNWTPNAHHLGIYAARELGWYRNAGIDLEIVEPTEAGAEQAVGRGTAEFGVSIAEGVLPARAAGIPIVSIGTILPVNDSALMSLAEDGITTPAGLAGKTYGGYNGPLETELINRLAECGGVAPDSVKHVEVGNVDYLAGLEANRYDVVWIFAGWDALRATEVAGREIDLVRFEDYFDCIPNWYTPLFITSEEMIEKSPDLVRRFLDVTTRGYQLAIDEPARGADLMLDAVPEMDEKLIRAAADYYAPKFTADGEPFGTQDRATWQTFEAFLVDAGLLEQPVDVDATFTNEFLPR